MHYSSPLHLIKLRFGHIKRGARRRRCRLCRRRLGQRSWARCEKSGSTQNVIDKQACASMKPAKYFCPTGRASNKLRGLFTPCLFFFSAKIQSRCSTSNSRWPEKSRASVALSAAAEVKELCPHQRQWQWDFTQVTWGWPAMIWSAVPQPHTS